MGDDEAWQELFAMAEGGSQRPAEGGEAKMKKRSKLADYRMDRCERDNTTTKPLFWQYHNSFEINERNGKPICKRYKKDPLRTGASFSTSLCRRCRRPQGGHIVVANKNVISTIRNVRCWCRLAIMTRQADSTAVLQEISTSDVQRTIQQVNPKIPIPACKNSSFPDLIRCIIACDDAYYQLYYQSLLDNNSGSRVVPQPITYFGEWNDVEDAAATDGVIRDDNILALLQRLRTAETHALFQDYHWAEDTCDEAGLVPKEPHATLAPQLLQEWRDSCRDFLCHLYCYATIPNSVIRQIRDEVWSAQQQKQSLIEFGAGTGYLAKLLQDLNVSVACYDVSPDASNEYHGSTPSFTEVRKGHVKDKKIWKRHRDSALILCYPPPKDPMAAIALRNFLKYSSSGLFVHIGEFKGLTGSPEFEAFLLQNFDCTHRWSCLHWGTDAAQVTVWRTKRRNGADGVRHPTLLLPCAYSSCCSGQESKKRCRWLRTVSYCSQLCFDKDQANRQELLERFMIPGVRLDFDSDRDFESLEQ